MSFRRVLAAGAALPLLTVTAPWASADDISNNLDATIDAVAEVMPLNVGGDAGTTTLAVTPRNGDGKNGCNLTAATTLTLAIASSDTSVATVSPSSVTFTACSDTKLLTVTPHAEGTATVSARQTANTTGATFDLTRATFTVDVAPPANTAPTLTIAGVTDGASYTKGSVPAATCEVADAEDGPSSYAATLTAVAGPYAADGIGSRTASCSYTDGGGLQASSSVTYSIVDVTVPVVGYTLSPAAADGDNGWYRTAVTLDWTVTETDSPSSLVLTGCEDTTVTDDQAATEYTCEATSAGGTSDPASVTLKKDGAAPDAPTVTALPAPNAAGWNNTDVTVSFTANGDNGPSGVADCTDAVLVDTETDSRSVSGTCTDAAGNTSSAAATTVKLDKTAPSTPVLSTLTDGASYDFGSVPAEPTCTATDALSGDAGCVVTGYSAAVGSHTVTATAHDVAGNTSTASVSYTVMPYRFSGFYSPVDMGNVLNTVKAGSTVPLKFEVFTSTAELTSTSTIAQFSVREVSCASLGTALSDAVEVTTTGGTALRYDATAGQFMQNWKTPAGAGRCYAVTVTTNDGQTRGPALFKLK